MQHFRALRTISLILGFILVTFGCATSKNQVTNADFGLTAEAVPEGLLITFRNIPADAIRMTINVSYWDTDEYDNPYNFISSFADLRDASLPGGSVPCFQLDKVKQTGRVIFPIVQTYEKYNVLALVFNERDHELNMSNDENYKPLFAEAEFIPENGIYFNRSDVRLDINDTHSVVTLSSEPVFSSEVKYSSQKYSFGVTILVDDKGSIGVGDHHIPVGLSPDGLTWTFGPHIRDDIRESESGTEWLERGTYYTAWASAYVNIVYDDIIWEIEIANTPTFDFSM